MLPSRATLGEVEEGVVVAVGVIIEVEKVEATTLSFKPKIGSEMIKIIENDQVHQSKVLARSKFGIDVDVKGIRPIRVAHRI